MPCTQKTAALWGLTHVSHGAIGFSGFRADSRTPNPPEKERKRKKRKKTDSLYGGLTHASRSPPSSIGSRRSAVRARTRRSPCGSGASSRPPIRRGDPPGLSRARRPGCGSPRRPISPRLPLARSRPACSSGSLWFPHSLWSVF